MTKDFDKYLQNRDDPSREDRTEREDETSDLKRVLDLQRKKNDFEISLYKKKIDEQFAEIARLEMKLEKVKQRNN